MKFYIEVQTEFNVNKYGHTVIESDDGKSFRHEYAKDPLDTYVDPFDAETVSVMKEIYHTKQGFSIGILEERWQDKKFHKIIKLEEIIAESFFATFDILPDDLVALRGDK